MITQNQIQKAKEVLLKHLLTDCLKSEYDGMTAYDISKLMLEASELESNEQQGRDHDLAEQHARVEGYCIECLKVPVDEKEELCPECYASKVEDQEQRWGEPKEDMSGASDAEQYPDR